MIDTKSINFFRLLFLLSYLSFFLSVYFAIVHSVLLFILTMVLALTLDHFIPNKYAIRFEKHWHVKESLFFHKVSGTTEKKVFILFGIFIIGIIFFII